MTQNDTKPEKKFIHGDYGLPATFWGFGLGATFLVIFFLTAIVQSFESDNSFVFVMAIFFLYSIIISIAIWRSSDQYDGPAYWAVFAKIAVILVFGTVCIINLYVYAMLTSHFNH